MRKVIERCPSCDHPEVFATALQCPECGTEVRGAFATSRFCRISEPSLDFIENFVRNRGNLKEMERELGIGYATLRSRLNDIIAEMGYERVVDEPSGGEDDVAAQRERRIAVLDRLASGEATAEQAISELRDLAQ